MISWWLVLILIVFSVLFGFMITLKKQKVSKTEPENFCGWLIVDAKDPNGVSVYLNINRNPDILNDGEKIILEVIKVTANQFHDYTKK